MKILTKATSSFELDKCSDAINDWELEVYPLARGNSRMDLQQSQATRFCFLDLSQALKSEHIGCCVASPLTFLLTETPTATVNLQGKAQSINTLVCAPTGSELYLLTPNATRIYSLSIAEELLESILASYLSKGPEFLYPRFTALYPLSAEQADELRVAFRVLARMLSKAESGVQALSTVEYLEHFIVPKLIEIIVKSPFTLSKGKFGNHYPLSDLLSTIHRNLDSPPTVNELADLSGLTTRAVQILFAKHIGLSPLAYMKAKRLHEVKNKLLKQPLARGAIVDTANEMGFWHMGQFSKDFKRQFGYNPRDTRQFIEQLEDGQATESDDATRH